MPVSEKRFEDHVKQSRRDNDDLKTLIKEGFKGINGKVRRNTHWRYGITGGLVLTNALLLPLVWLIVSKLIDKII